MLFVPNESVGLRAAGLAHRAARSAYVLLRPPLWAEAPSLYHPFAPRDGGGTNDPADWSFPESSRSLRGFAVVCQVNNCPFWGNFVTP
jgi:hypothetical protein